MAQDVDEIYTLAAESLQKAVSPAERRKAFRTALLRAYEAGVDAQREIVVRYAHDRPTPVPPSSAVDLGEDPGVLPPARPTGSDPEE